MSETDYFSFVDADRSVLDGHKRRRKKLVAPLSDLPLTKHISFAHDIYPELLWIGRLFDENGFRGGVEIAALFQLALERLAPSRPIFKLSCISQLARQEWDSLTEEDGPFKDRIVEALLPISMIYNDLSFEFIPHDRRSSEDALEKMSKTVGKHWNRFETPGAALIAAYCFLLALTGRMHVSRDFLEGLNSIVAEPGSDAAELASSMARATMLGSWVAADDESDWPKRFWRANWKISPCKLRRHE